MVPATVVGSCMSPVWRFPTPAVRCRVVLSRVRDGSEGEPMAIELNHTIVHVRDRWSASREVGHVLGLPEATAYGPFAELKLDNAVSLDFMDTEGDIHGQHYAFLVSEREFDLVLGRLRDSDREWWADPFRRQPHEINHEDGGRGLYWRARTGTGWRSSPVHTAAAPDLHIGSGLATSLNHIVDLLEL